MNQSTYEMLAYQGSLTAYFKNVMGVSPTLSCLKQGYAFPTSKERELLDIPARQYALIREIKMGKGDENWLFARSVIPLETLQGTAKRITSLRHVPIGKILFGRNGAKRSWMQVSLAYNLPDTLECLGDNMSPPLWKRQSIFRFTDKPLLVSEYFLPDCPIYEDR
ncbi:MAG: chorismate lyase [Gammaproteobacteria bacterium]|nr:chorismate lyase [Gammaproteobacteria bacterium]MDH5629166.1 chorismate lyase [Gammaproteobacteria bacterium]